MNDIVRLAEKLQGPIEIEKLTVEDIETGKFNASCSWLPPISHPDLTSEQAEGFLNQIMIAYILFTATGAWDGLDEWNQRLPDYEFVGVGDFIQGIWSDA